MHPPIILASASPYRRELLARLGLAFDVDATGIDETPVPGESFADTAQRLARMKALAVAMRRREAIVIGSDQVASCDGVRLDKPGTADVAMEQLRRQRGRMSEFHTAVCVAEPGGHRFHEAVVTTRVRMRDATELTDARLAQYLRQESALDCAGSAKSEGLGIALMASIEGPDPTALIGLPLIALTDLLARAGADPLQAGRDSDRSAGAHL
jgi:septum formation protein